MVGRVVAGIVALAALALGPVTAQAAYPGANGEIAFVGPAPEEASPASGIWLVGAGGTDARRAAVALGPGQLRWSPDGRVLTTEPKASAYATDFRVTGGGAGRQGLEPLGRPLLGTIGNDEHFRGSTFSPDARSMAATYLPPSYIPGSTYPPSGLYVVDTARVLRGESTTELARTGRLVTTVAGSEPTWSPDGRWIAHTGCDQGGARCGLWLSDVEGRWGTGLLLPQSATTRPDLAIVEPDWSPDSRHLVFGLRGGEFQGETDGIWRVRVDGPRLRRLAPTGSSPAYSPDGRRIVYADGRGLSLLTRTGRALGRIHTGTASFPDWQPLPR